MCVSEHLLPPHLFSSGVTYDTTSVLSVDAAGIYVLSGGEALSLLAPDLFW